MPLAATHPAVLGNDDSDRFIRHADLCHGHGGNRFNNRTALVAKLGRIGLNFFENEARHGGPVVQKMLERFAFVFQRLDFLLDPDAFQSCELP